MIYVGLDVHKGFSRAGVFDPATGAIEDLGKVSNEASALRALLAPMKPAKTVVLEAGRNSHWLAGLLETLAEEVWVVDPGEVRRLQRTVSKTDRRDAGALAWWAAKGVLKPQWRPSAELLNLRELTRGKTVLTRLSTRLRNMIRKLLARHGYECPHSDLLGERAQTWFETVQLEGYAGELLAALRGILVLVQAHGDAFERKVNAAARDYAPAQLLRTLPGVGPYLSLALAVEIGDVHRFPSPVHLRGYSGLTPTVYQSGEKDHRGPLTKRGNRWLRYAAVLAAQRLSQMRHPDPRLKHTFVSVAFRHGRNPGKIAAARRLLDFVYHLLKEKEV